MFNSNALCHAAPCLTENPTYTVPRKAHNQTAQLNHDYCTSPTRNWACPFRLPTGCPDRKCLPSQKSLILRPFQLHKVKVCFLSHTKSSVKFFNTSPSSHSSPASMRSPIHNHIINQPIYQSTHQTICQHLFPHVQLQLSACVRYPTHTCVVSMYKRPKTCRD